MSWHLHPAAWLLAADWAIRLAALAFIPARHPPAAARGWLMLVGFVPLAGLPLYLLLGRPWLSRTRVARQARATQAIRAAFPERADALLERDDDGIAHLVRLLGGLPPQPGNAVRLLPGYAEAIDALVADIDAARHEVHLLYYIVADDDCGGRVLSALRRAAARGVTCRMLADALASRRMLRASGPALRAAGIDLRPMMVDRVHNIAGRIDLRNHRKLAVIDGGTGYVGSQNLVSPDFIPGAPNVELVARLQGPAVAQLQAVFASDWFIETGEDLSGRMSLPETREDDACEAQLLPCGPAYPHENARDLLVALVHSARRSLTLCTPYFVPDEAMLRALCITAERGVRTRLVVSARNNQPLADWAQRGYYDVLLRSGVEIHRFHGGFLHAKHLLVDDALGLVGSINLDVRSFALNAEVGALLRGHGVADALHEVQDGYLAQAQTLTLRAWRARPRWHRSVEGLARLADVFL